ncbi:MAG: amidohydrolase family protein [Armatimonadetes bacterium]|nr:amidohydrolase family protein [Armatimonadota bacterium]
MDFQIIDANTLFGFHPIHKLDMSIERLMRDMERYKIGASITLSTIGLFCDYVEGNKITKGAATANSRLIPAGTVNPQGYFGTDEDMRAIVSQGFRIFRFFPAEQGWPIDSAAFKLVLKQLASFKVAVMVDAGKPGEPTALAHVVADYPGAVIMCSISAESIAEALAVMLEMPNVMVETHELHVPGALKVVAERVGANRVIFGSGAPRRSTASSLNSVLNSELSDAEKQLVLGGNIKRILEVG